MLYGSWDMECDRQNFLSFWTGFFPPFYPCNNPKNHNFEKMKKTPRDIIILHMCTIIDNHDVWFLRYEAWQNFLSFCTVFCPFTPPNSPKYQHFKKWKKTLEISSFYNSGPKIMITCTVPEIWHVIDVIAIFHFGLFFAIFPT